LNKAHCKTLQKVEILVKKSTFGDLCNRRRTWALARKEEPLPYIALRIFRVWTSQPCCRGVDAEFMPMGRFSAFFITRQTSTFSPVFRAFASAQASSLPAPALFAARYSGPSVKTLHESAKSWQADAMRGAIRAASLCATFWENRTPEMQNPPWNGGLCGNLCHLAVLRFPEIADRVKGKYRFP
jgi:hypothetical protein